MKKPALITAKWLRQFPYASQLCAKEIRRFERMYPNGMRVILPSLRRCAKANFDIRAFAFLLWPYEDDKPRTIFLNEISRLGWYEATLGTIALRHIEAEAFALAWRAWKEE